MNNKFKALYNLIMSLKPVWDESTTEERNYLETVIGAGIFYLPTNKNTFSGYISEQALRVDKKQRVKEHQWPRKITAKILLQNPPSSVEELSELYHTKYGTWNWVTKQENSELRKSQKEGVFSTPEESYKQTGVKMTIL